MMAIYGLMHIFPIVSKIPFLIARWYWFLICFRRKIRLTDYCFWLIRILNFYIKFDDKEVGNYFKKYFLGRIYCCY